MDRFINNNEFDKDVIYNKLAELSSKIEEERSKNPKEYSLERERELMYAQMIQGMKLNTFFSNRRYYF
jgi:hypothetical protein